MDKKTLWFIIGGGGALLLLALIAVVIVLATGGEERRAEVPPVRTETPPPTTPTPTPAQPTTPTPPPRREEPPATQAGPQRLAQACRTTWQGSEAVCSCVMRAVQPVLQAGDYDAAIEIMNLVFTNKGDDARQRVTQLVTQNPERAQRVVAAVQAIGRDCKDVR